MTPTRFISVCCASALLVTGCGSGPVSSTATSGTPAFARDFDAYDTWESFIVAGSETGGAVDGGAQAHTGGARTIYLNQRPRAGATEFPVGTFIVKQGAFNTFAMHKRGGTYNQNGAKGWEWVEIERASNGKAVIAWQGLGAPEGEKYGDIDVTCTDCHKAATENDSVLGLEMQLSTLAK